MRTKEQGQVFMYQVFDRFGGVWNFCSIVRGVCNLYYRSVMFFNLPYLDTLVCNRVTLA